MYSVVHECDRASNGAPILAVVGSQYPQSFFDRDVEQPTYKVKTQTSEDIAKRPANRHINIQYTYLHIYICIVIVFEVSDSSAGFPELLL